MLPIVVAAYSRTMLQAALAYAEMGLSVLPCNRDKTPATKQWKTFMEMRASYHVINGWSYAGRLQSVGIILGTISRGLVVIDLDGEEAITVFRKEFPALFGTYTVTSGSRKGAHLYLYTEEIPPTTRTVGQPYGNIELRSNGSYVIAPPSMHPSGYRYTVSNDQPIMHVKRLQAVREWIERQIKEKHGGVMPPSANKPERIINATQYARVALQDECQKVSGMVNSRNIQLNVSAFKLGRLIREQKISRSEVEQALEQAAAHLAATDGLKSVQRTIASGIDAGIEKAGLG